MADRAPIFLDTSVVMYAAGTDHPLREPCAAALRAAVVNSVPLVTSAEVLQEILHRYFSIGRPGVGEAVFHSTRELCTRVLSIEEVDAVRALQLLLEHPSLSPRDAVHCATAERAGIERVLSTDADFDSVKTLTRIDPRSYGS
jgi:predicted nucleic acid-binding protein